MEGDLGEPRGQRTSGRVKTAEYPLGRQPHVAPKIESQVLDITRDSTTKTSQCPDGRPMDWLGIRGYESFERQPVATHAGIDYAGFVISQVLLVSHARSLPLWAKGEGRRAKGEGRRAKGEGRRAKGEDSPHVRFYPDRNPLPRPFGWDAIR